MALCLIPASAAPLRLAIAGLVHGHVDGFFRAMRNRTDVQLVGVADPDAALQKRYAEKYKLDSSLFFKDVATMLDRSKARRSGIVHQHLRSSGRGGSVRRAKDRRDDGKAAGRQHGSRSCHSEGRGSVGIQVIVNYETTWYPSHALIWDVIKQQKAGGAIRKMVAMDGHQGPKEINVPPEFFGWLSDPVKNGAGALFDFGCYGANLMTWLMDNQRPVAVTAVTQTMKPSIYPRVDDEATILVEYPKAQGIIEASWNWPFSRKDLEVYADRRTRSPTAARR